jgi:DNA ligase (NAD+)
MSSKVNYLVNNDNTSTSAKNIAAQKAGIPIITEEELQLMFD